MVNLTRRKTVIGLGLLATGSGATFTSATFQSGTTPDSDLRVLVEQNLEFKANPDLDPIPEERDDLTDNPGFFDGDDDGTEEPSGGLNETADGAFSDAEGFQPNTPLAYVEGANENLVVKTAVDIGSSHTFDGLFRIDNPSSENIRVGIGYDRNRGEDANGQYGADIGASSPLSYDDAQTVYQFIFNNSDSTDARRMRPDNDAKNSRGLISPDPGNDGVDGDADDGFDIADASDRPWSAIDIDPGGSAVIDLEVNTGGDDDSTNSDPYNEDLEERIRGAADISPSQFGFQSDTVQIMEAISVVSMNNVNSSS